MNRFNSTLGSFASDQGTSGQAEQFGDGSADFSDGEFPESPSAWGAALAAQTFFIPINYEPNYRYPLIVWLHSDGFNENQVCHVMPHVSKRNYIATGLRAPHAIDSSGHRFCWRSSEAAFSTARQSVLEAIDRAARQYSIHRNRIVLAGFQSGGTMAMQIAMRHPDRFAAAVSLGGRFGLPDESEFDRVRLQQRQLPMLWQRAMETETFDLTQLTNEVQLAAEIRAKLEVRQYRSDDEMNTAVLSDLDRWIMEHVVMGSPVGRIGRWDTSPTAFSEN